MRSRKPSSRAPRSEPFPPVSRGSWTNPSDRPATREQPLLRDAADDYKDEQQALDPTGDTRPGSSAIAVVPRARTAHSQFGA
jgi:hypothetical protein